MGEVRRSYVTQDRQAAIRPADRRADLPGVRPRPPTAPPMQRLALLAAAAAALVFALVLVFRTSGPGPRDLALGGGPAVGEAGGRVTASELAPVVPGGEGARSVAASAPGADGTGQEGAAAPAGSLVVTVLAPAGTPDDEEVEVLALTTELGLGRVLSAIDLERAGDRTLGEPTGFDELAQDADRLEFQRAAIVARARAARDGEGRFVAALDAPRDRALWLHVAGTHLRTARPTEVPAGATTAELTPALGGALVITLVAGDGGFEVADQALKVTRAAAGAVPGAGLAPGPGESVRQTRRTAADGTVRLRALPTGAELEVALFPDLAAPDRTNVPALAPGETRAVTIPLAPAGKVVGVVTDPHGAPIAGASVLVLRRGQAFGFDDVELRRGTAAEDGRFEVGGLPAGKLVVRAEADAWLQSEGASVELRGAESVTGLVLALREGKRIAGTARFADGRAAAGVEVLARFDVAHMAGPAALGFTSGRSGRAVADEDGRFEVRGLGAGPFAVTAEARVDASEHVGASGSVYRGRRDGVRPGVSDLALTLHAPLALAGRVIDDEGAAVGDVEVTIVRVTEGAVGSFDQALHTCRTQATTGAFRCDDLLSGTYDLLVQSPTHVTLEPIRATLPEDGARDLTLTATRAATVRGRVASPTGSPVAEADVRVAIAGPEWSEQLQKRPPSARAKSLADGTFELRGVPPKEVSLGATSPDWGRAAATPLTLAAAEVREGVTLTLSNGGTITGEVYDDEGRPAVGRMIQVQRGDGGGQRQASSDADGRFRIAHIDPGKYQVIAIDLARMGAAGESSGDDGLDVGGLMNALKMASADVVDGEEVHVVLGAPPTSPVKVSGRVRRAGDAVANALVTFLPAGPKMVERMKFASTNEDGEFALVLDEPGDHVVAVQVSVGGIGQQATTEFRADVPEGAESRHDFDLPGGRISGRLMDDEGRGVVGARVSLSTTGGMRTDQLMGGNTAEIVSGPGGAFTLDGLRSGTYRVAAGGATLFGAGGAEHGRVVRTGIALGENEALEGVDLVLPRPGSLAVTVKGRDGAPRAEATVFVRDEGGEPIDPLSFVRTDASGHAKIEGLAPGRYTVSARWKGEASGESALVGVRAGAESSAAVVLDPGTVVRVALRRKGDGAPPMGSIQVFDDAGREVTGIFGLTELQELYQSGAYSRSEHRLGPLAPGRYRVLVRTASGEEDRRVTLRGEPECVINLTVD